MPTSNPDQCDCARGRTDGHDHARTHHREVASSNLALATNQRRPPGREVFIDLVIVSHRWKLEELISCLRMPMHVVPAIGVEEGALASAFQLQSCSYRDPARSLIMNGVAEL
jgi:hypothetical protein